MDKRHFLGNKTEKFLHVFKEAVIILVYDYTKKKLWNIKKSQFLLLTYWLDSPVFLKEVARDVVRTVSLCGNLQNMFF